MIGNVILRSVAVACFLLPVAVGAQSAAGASYGGVGLQIDASTGVPVVVAVSPDGPAGQAGIQPGDQIVAIDGKPTAGWSHQAAVDALRGPIASTVTVIVDRTGSNPRTLTLARAEIRTRPTSWINARRVVWYYLLNAGRDMRGMESRAPMQYLLVSQRMIAFTDSGVVKGSWAADQRTTPFARLRMFRYETLAPRADGRDVYITGTPNSALRRLNSAGDYLRIRRPDPGTLVEERFTLRTPEEATQFAQALEDLVRASRLVADEDAQFAVRAAAWRAMRPKPPLSVPGDRNRILGEQAMREKEMGRALQHFENAILTDPTWPSGNFNLALLYEAFGQAEEAARYMKRFLLLEPESNEAPAARQKVIIWEDRARRMLPQ